MLSSHDALHFRRTSAFVIGVHLSMASHSKAFTVPLSLPMASRCKRDFLAHFWPQVPFAIHLGQKLSSTAAAAPCESRAGSPGASSPLLAWQLPAR